MKVVTTTTETYEAFITELDWPDIDHETEGKAGSRCTCVWRPVAVRFVWHRMSGTDWQIIDRQVYCKQVINDGTELGRNHKTFDFSPSPLKIPTIDEPAGLAELEAEHHPKKYD
jgi:hypothetical protein